METLSADYLVLGSGIAGLRAALALAKAGRVLVVTKDDPSESNTGYAQGGVAVALGPEDEPSLHLEDTLQAGAGIVTEAAARVLVEEGPDRIREMSAWGARFDREEGRIHLTREAAHSRSRVLHALGDATGWELVRALLAQTQRAQGIEVRSFACSTDLELVNGRVRGCRFLAAGGESVRVVARATLLATGGAGQVFAQTTNPRVATGDGVAMAWRAGANLLDMEFVQFHPTALAIPGAPRFLISEAVRGEGAYLINGRGERFTDELRPRDQVARAIARENHEGRGPVRLDLRHLARERVKVRFPRIYATCLSFGVDLTEEPLPVTPAAHYTMGGVATDLYGRSSLPGLYAAGEVACSGVHGANRLASNSLLEGLVFATRAAQAMLDDAPRLPAAGAPETLATGASLSDDRRSELQQRSWDDLGLERNAVGLQALVSFVEELRLSRARAERPSAEMRNLVDVAEAMAICARFREESRGAHFRTDFPATDDGRFLGHTLLEGRRPRLTPVLTPVPAGARC